MRPTLRYVALGDSYTIGTSVPASERWPDRLIAALDLGPVRLALVANLAVSGWTSGDVVRAQLPELDLLRPEFASLLVGVNDVVQGVPPERYRANIEAILDDLLRRLPADRVLVVTTPDYTVTPAGADYGDPATRRAGILSGKRDPDRARSRPRDRSARHLRHLGAGRDRPLARRFGRPPPFRRAVRLVGRADRPGRGRTHRPLIRDARPAHLPWARSLRMRRRDAWGGAVLRPSRPMPLAEVLRLIAARCSKQEIADAPFISRKTASVHASHIFYKLGAAYRIEAARS